MSEERRNSLSPPVRRDTMDPGAHELGSDSEEHYSDAQSGPSGSSPASPIPRTRVERVDDKPAYGEVPGTSAYRMREEDAAPDEIAFIPDPDSKDMDPTEAREADDQSPTPGGHPIPKTVVEETHDAANAVTHAEIEEKHKADPPPDLILKADGEVVVDGGAASDTPISPSLRTPASPHSLRRRKSSNALRRSPLSPGLSGPRSAGFGSFDDNNDNNNDKDVGDGDQDFGDDFDDFEEGDDGEDFDEFEDGFEQADEAATDSTPDDQPPPAPPAPSMSFPVPDLDDLDAGEIFAVTEPYLDALFPPPDALPPLLPSLSSHKNPIFLTPRSASLWSQLVAPPPLQPPDWIRSRIRRLFLVSLGVPVDLDEILPASKQKKLVLPSLHRVNSSGSLRTSTDSRSLSRARHTNVSSTSVDSQGNLKPSSSTRPLGGGDAASVSTSTAATAGGTPSSSSNKRKGSTHPHATFDLMTARQLCTATDEALQGMTEKELKEHIAKLEEMEGTAKAVLEYWQKRTDEKLGDREAFEGVIENLVKHARKVRK
ncbi:hypothetical protein B0H63DRAFT_484935 [Podospora didyma]|uniref:Uncharacterized protein n=1 Tax=Podospora didyma TaxID=330526 RepID=A0AAE0K9A4_9PEZI|nr:hypothetical protein B0H63DRAFT_484935 [Podospora didyma]